MPFSIYDNAWCMVSKKYDAAVSFSHFRQRCIADFACDSLAFDKSLCCGMSFWPSGSYCMHSGHKIRKRAIICGELSTILISFVILLEMDLGEM